MSKLNIITVPDPVLKQVAHPVEKIDDAIRKQIDDMFETMYDAPGIGLAANQVGILNRIFVMDVAFRDKDAERTPVAMINPEIIWKSEDISIMEEGCLSIPQQFAEVQRPAVVRVRYLDVNGVFQEMEASELASHCVQHELDHLDGVLFVDHLSRMKRTMILRKLEKLKKNSDLL
jgi:peptide deformylase